jgi:hypothetical protein
LDRIAAARPAAAAAALAVGPTAAGLSRHPGSLAALVVHCS